MSDPMGSALAELVTVLGRLGIRYAVGGSLASSAHGTIRATLDADLIALIAPVQLRALSTALGKAWYCDEEMMERALRGGSAFNLIHIGSAIKVDIFPATSQFHHAQLERARMTHLQPPVAVDCMVTTAEDILLAKLSWYNEGGRISDRQWNDITGLIAANTAMDWPYVNDWATRLGLADLLQKARNDAAE